MKLIEGSPAAPGAALALLIYTGVAVAQSVALPHVHGLAYSADGKQLFIPSHDGLAIYSNSRWSKASGPQHDYMGFSVTKNRFYSSGHPAPGSALKNPFGLIVSGDGGRTWDKRGLEGESDSVHPSNPRIVAVATKDGLFLSTGSGAHFERLTAGQALAACFDLDAEHLFYSMHDGAARRYRQSLKSRSRSEVPLPSLTQDAVSYIAQNPADRAEYAIATFERSVFLSRNMGKNWTQIARNGQTIDGRKP